MFKGALNFFSDLIYYYFVFVAGFISYLPSDNSSFLFNDNDYYFGIGLRLVSLYKFQKKLWKVEVK